MDPTPDQPPRLTIDIPIGRPHDPHAPVLDAFATRGAPIADATVPRLRSGNISGFRTAYRLTCAERARRE